MSDKQSIRLKELPPWLSTNSTLVPSTEITPPEPTDDTDLAILAQKHQIQAELEIHQYPAIYDMFLDCMVNGRRLSWMAKHYNLRIHAGRFMRWIYADEERAKRYEDTYKVTTRVWGEKALDTAEGVDEFGEDTLEDIARSKLKVETYWKMMQAWDNDRFAPRRNADVEVNVNLIGAMERAEQRLAERERRIIEGECVEHKE